MLGYQVFSYFSQGNDCVDKFANHGHSVLGDWWSNSLSSWFVNIFLETIMVCLCIVFLSFSFHFFCFEPRPSVPFLHIFLSFNKLFFGIYDIGWVSRKYQPNWDAWESAWCIFSLKQPKNQIFSINRRKCLCWRICLWWYYFVGWYPLKK